MPCTTLDDVWASDSSASDGERAGSDRVAAREWARLHQIHGTHGFREGVAAAKESGLQRGFDAGFADACVLGHRVGVLIGRASAVAALAAAGRGASDSVCARMRAVLAQTLAMKNDDNVLRALARGAAGEASAFAASDAAATQTQTDAQAVVPTLAELAARVDALEAALEAAALSS